MNAPNEAAWSREEIDAELARLRADQERIAASLLDLENHVGHRLLKDAVLTGVTLRRWERTQVRIAALWRLFEAYRVTLARAEELRGRRARPDADDRDALTVLLAGQSVEPAGGELPLEQRTLLGPTIERLSLSQAVARMTADYTEAVDSITAIDQAWSTLLADLERTERVYRSCEQLAADLEAASAELDRLGRALAAVRDAIRADPLDYDRTRSAELADLLAALEAELRSATRLRAEYDDRIAIVMASIAEVRATEAELVPLREEVARKILSALPPNTSGKADRLDVHLRDVVAVRRAGGWHDLLGELAGLESAVTTTLATVRAGREQLQGLLDRRSELRGLLDAYRAKAARLGHAENAELAVLYARAHELLWTAPCDLRASTMAVRAYQHAIG